ncbi:MAG: alpha/beta hydrolase [Crocinitomicaceae bacterium]|nr:alpha/beta hydrolase [Crocinitomicaceae bacterium]
MQWIIKVSAFILLGFIMFGCGFNGLFYYPNVEHVETPEFSQSHYIKYSDQDSIHALFYKKNQPIATIFFLHGNAGSLDSWSSLGQLFYKENFNVFMIDFPGFGNSTGKAKHEPTYEAAQAAVEYFKSMPEIQDSKKLLMGF